MPSLTDPQPLEMAAIWLRLRQSMETEITTTDESAASEGTVTDKCGLHESARGSMSVIHSVRHTEESKEEEGHGVIIEKSEAVNRTPGASGSDHAPSELMVGGSFEHCDPDETGHMSLDAFCPVRELGAHVLRHRGALTQAIEVVYDLCAFRSISINGTSGACVWKLMYIVRVAGWHEELFSQWPCRRPQIRLGRVYFCSKRDPWKAKTIPSLSTDRRVASVSTRPYSDIVPKETFIEDTHPMLMKQDRDLRSFELVLVDGQEAYLHTDAVPQNATLRSRRLHEGNTDHYFI